ncbi:MAG: ATP-binding protein [Methanophagales archaeon]|nr:ATP-binding protein [Methanophagales archaeon]
MVGEKIINWLKTKKLKKITDYININVEIAPCVTLFGIINFSFAKGKIKLTPEEWDDNDKERIADFLRSEGVGISLEEFKESLKEEIKKVSEETQKLILDEIKRLLVENPLVSLEEFEKRPEIKPLLEYEFVGRESELGELHEFLENDKEVFVITGEGGFGKTRLAIEFARQVANDNWDVYFIDRDKDFKHSVVSIVLSGKSVLLILDDASRYPERNKVVGFVQNPPEDINVKTVKLLLIDRAIFKESIENELKERNASAQYLQIENGDIPSFLKEHFEIQREDVEQIEKESRGNFVIAIFLAELYRDKGRIGRQKEAIEHRIAKYKEDIREYRSMSIGDIDNILFLLSLLTPIEWEKDYKYFEEVLTRYLPEYDFQHLKAIIGLADRNTDFFLLRSGERYVFKYDLIADYLLSQFINIKGENFDRVMSKFFPYMSFRISYNIFVIPRFFREEAEKAVQILGQIWIKLNEVRGQTPEYFSALVLFTGDLSSLPFFDIEKIDISHWLSCYKEVSKTYPEKGVEVKEKLAMGLVNATNRYGEAKRFNEMRACLKELKALHEEHPEEKEVRENLASGLFNATSHYGEAERFDEMEACLKELRALHEEHPEKEVREKHTMGLVNATSHYGKAERFDEMEACLKELRALHEEHPEKEVRGKLAMGLFNATSHYGEVKRFDEMETRLKDLRALHIKHPEKEVREELAKGLVNATSHYGKAKRFDEMEACLKDLRALHEEHPEKEVREKLASGLVNATTYKKPDYETLLLLYKLRFDLPDDVNKEKRIKVIEDSFMRATKERIEEIYDEDEGEHFEEFLNSLKAEIEDTELVLLMNEISERLDIRIQRKMWELLSL